MREARFCKEFVKHRMYHAIGEMCPCFKHGFSFIWEMKQDAFEKARNQPRQIAGSTFKDIVKKIKAGYYDRKR